MNMKLHFLESTVSPLNAMWNSNNGQSPNMAIQTSNKRQPGGVSMDESTVRVLPRGTLRAMNLPQGDVNDLGSPNPALNGAEHCSFSADKSRSTLKSNSIAMRPSHPSSPRKPSSSSNALRSSPRKGYSASKSIPIPANNSMRRTDSELQLVEDEAVAEYRDYCMYTRIVNGISGQQQQQQNHSWKGDTLETLRHIVKTRHQPVLDDLASRPSSYVQESRLRHSITKGGTSIAGGATSATSPAGVSSDQDDDSSSMSHPAQEDLLAVAPPSTEDPTSSYYNAPAVDLDASARLSLLDISERATMAPGGPPALMTHMAAIPLYIPFEGSSLGISDEDDEDLFEMDDI